MNYEGLDPYVDEMEWLIAFYKSQYLKFKRIGLYGFTEFNVKVTQKLIDCTANRLNQLIKGEKTSKNMGRAEKIIRSRSWGFWCGEGNHLHDSNRTFGWDNTSTFHHTNLGEKERMNSRYISEKHLYEECQPVYIDKITTAYKSDIMVAILSHEN